METHTPTAAGMSLIICSITAIVLFPSHQSESASVVCRQWWCNRANGTWKAREDGCGEGIAAGAGRRSINNYHLDGLSTG